MFSRRPTISAPDSSDALSEDSQSRHFNFFEIAQHFLLSLIAISYGTGFLVVFTFLQYFGLKESAMDIFRAKYIYVGLLHLWVPLTVIVPVGGLILINQRRHESANLPATPNTATELWPNTLLAISCVVTAITVLLHGSRYCLSVTSIITLLFYIIAALFRSVRRPLTETYAYHKDTAPMIRFPHFTLLITINLSLVLYVYIAFAPIGLFEQYQFSFDKLFFISVVGVYFVGWTVKKILFPGMQRRYFGLRMIEVYPRFFHSKFGKIFAHHGQFGRSYFFCKCYKFVLTICLIGTIASCEGDAIPDQLWNDVRQMLEGGGWRYPVFLLLAVFVLTRVYYSAKRSSRFTEKLTFWLIGLAIGTSLYYLSVINFARKVYPYIPASKGGGDFGEGPYVTLVLTTNMIGALPLSIIDTNTSDKRFPTTIPLVLIDEHDTHVFVADPNDPPPYGHKVWRLEHFPKIIDISRNNVLSVTFLSGNTK
jgi:hypothetical protein